MRCSEIMKRDIECASPDDTVESAAETMRAQNVGFVPICDEDDQVLGTLTDRDIAIRLVAEHKSSDTAVREIMTADCVACRPEDDVATAAGAMAEHQKSRIMCLDDDGRLVGVISLSDIAQRGDDSASATLRQVAHREAKPAQMAT
jgi:CBS domain-containing protein